MRWKIELWTYIDNFDQRQSPLGKEKVGCKWPENEVEEIYGHENKVLEKHGDYKYALEMDSCPMLANLLA